jgi:hypothetical protein
MGHLLNAPAAHIELKKGEMVPERGMLFASARLMPRGTGYGWRNRRFATAAV